jgi:uncharacterized protein
MTAAATNLSWLVSGFVERCPQVQQAVVASVDGLTLAASEGVARDDADRISAVSSGMIGLARGATGSLDAGSATNIIVEMERGWIFISGLRDGSLICALTGSGADIATLVYEIEVFARQAGDVLTPASRVEIAAAQGV